MGISPIHRSTWKAARSVRRGFTLMESLIAASILLVVVVAVTSAVTAGQQHAHEAQQRIAAGLAAEELMSRLLANSYTDLAAWNGHLEPVGAMTNIHGDPMPPTYDGIGRVVQVLSSLRDLPDVDVRVRGKTVRVQAFDRYARVLADLVRFVPEPQE